MPTELIVIFLLFFAVLAAAWFYLQRAKARPTTSVATVAESSTVPTPEVATNAEPTDERPAS